MFGLDYRVDVGAEHRTVQCIFKGSPVSSLKHGLGRTALCPGQSISGHVMGSERRRHGEVTLVIEQSDIQVPGQKLPLAFAGFVSVHVLGIIVSKTVPVANGVFKSEDSGPLLQIDGSVEEGSEIKLRSVHR